MRIATAVSVALLLVCASAGAAPAPDISGKWHAQVPWPGRNLTDFYFTFKVDGAKLTGTVAYPLGDNTYRLEILEGKVGGNDISFVALAKLRDTEMRWTFRGKVEGSEIPFSLEMPQTPLPGAPARAGQAGAPPPAGQAAPGPQVLTFTAKKTGS